MTTQQKPSRADAVRRRRTSQNPSKKSANIPRSGTGQRSHTSRQSYRSGSIFLPVEPRPVAPTTLHRMKASTLRQSFGVSSPAIAKGSYVGRSKKNSTKTGYDFAFSLGRTAVRAPLLSLPSLGSRWVSAVLTFLLVLLLYTLGTANTFKINSIEISGNQRLDSASISARAGLSGQSVIKAVPSQIEKDLLTAFPDLSKISVEIGFPNHVSLTVVERTPILAWYQDKNTTWIDPNGVAFTPRGDVPGLVQIAASGDPPRPAVDPQKSLNDQAFIDPGMVRAILALYPQIPGGAPMIYDPKYGMGWQDPRGWSVYFGQNTQEIEMKKQIYLAMLDTFSKQGIQPTLISVAYLDAPFYK